MINVVTNLLDEIVEIYEWDGALKARGVVRAVYVAGNVPMILVEHNLGFQSCSYNDRTKDGGFETYSLHEGRVRVVQRCGRCFTWDQKALLGPTYPGEGLEKIWEHRDGEGCKKVDLGG